MKNIDFTISHNQKLTLHIPDLPKKRNLYYKPSEKLDKFDQVSFFYIDNSNNIQLTEDSIGYILSSFSSVLKNALNKNLLIPNNVKPAFLGYEFNKETFFDYQNENQNIDYSKYWLFSDKEIQTWIYNSNDKICIEISPSYKWLYIEPKPLDNVISFDEFIKDYKPYAFFCISIQMAEKWIRTCNSFLQHLGYE